MNENLDCAKDLVAVIHHVLCEHSIDHTGSTEEIVRNVLTYCEQLPINFSGFGDSALYDQISELVKKEGQHDAEYYNEEQLTVKIISTLEQQLSNISEDDLLYTTIKLKSQSNKQQRNANSFSIFNFDDLPPLESLEDIIQDINENITSSMAWERLLNFDYLDLLEHPQWYLVIDTLQKILVVNTEKVFKEKVLLTVYAVCFRYLQAFVEHPQCGEIMSMISSHLLHQWTSSANMEEPGVSWSKLSKEEDGNIIWLQFSQSLPRVAKAQLTLFDQMCKAYVASKSCFTNELNNRLGASFLCLLSSGFVMVEDSTCPLIFIIASNDRLLATVTASMKSFDPFILFQQDIYCKFSQNIRILISKALRYGKITKTSGHLDFHLLCVGLVTMLYTMNSLFYECNDHTILSTSQERTSPQNRNGMTLSELKATNKKYAILVSQANASDPGNYFDLLSAHWKSYVEHRFSANLPDVNQKQETSPFVALHELLDELKVSFKHLSSTDLTESAAKHWTALVNSACEYLKTTRSSFFTGSNLSVLLFQELLSLIISIGERCGVSTLFENCLHEVTGIVVSYVMASYEEILIEPQLSNAINQLIVLLSSLLDDRGTQDSTGKYCRTGVCLSVLKILLSDGNECDNGSFKSKSNTILSTTAFLSSCRQSLSLKAHVAAMALLDTTLAVIDGNRIKLPSESDCTMLWLVSSQLSKWSIFLDPVALNMLAEVLYTKFSSDPNVFENQYTLLDVSSDRQFPLLLFEMFLRLYALHSSQFDGVFEIDEYLESYRERVMSISNIGIFRSASVAEEVSSRILEVVQRIDKSDAQQCSSGFSACHISVDRLNVISCSLGRNPQESKSIHEAITNWGNKILCEKIITQAAKTVSLPAYKMGTIVQVEIRQLMLHILHSWFSCYRNEDEIIKFTACWIIGGFTSLDLANFLAETVMRVVKEAFQSNLIGFENVWQSLCSETSCEYDT